MKKITNQQAKTNKSVNAYATVSINPDLDVLERDQLAEPAEEISTANLVGNKWVRFFDRANTFYYELDQMIKNSPTLGRIIADKARMALGGGFEVKRSDNIPVLAFFRKMAMRVFGDAVAQEVNDLIASVNMQGESLEKVSYKLFYDQIAFGNCFSEIIKTTKDGQPIVYLNHIPIDQVGIHIKNIYGVSPSIAVTKLWVKGRTPKNDEFNKDVQVIPMYPNFSSHTVEGSGVTHERAAIHIKEYAPNFEYWGMPSYISARFWGNIEYRIPKYNINKFKNGFLPSAIIQFLGSSSQEEAEDLIDSLVDTFTDTDNGSKIFAQVISDERDKVNVETIEDKSEGNYIELSRLAAQQIVTATGWTMSLAGHATAGKLGTNQQMRDEIEYVTNMCIKPLQRDVLDNIINVYLREVQEATNNNNLNNIYLSIANMQPISFAGEIDPNANLTTNEKRAVLGYDALSVEQIEEEKIIKDDAITTNTNTSGRGN